MAKPTKQQVEQAFIEKPDLGETFYHPASGGYAKPGKGDWTIYDWAERYGAIDLPNIFGGATSTPTPTPTATPSLAPIGGQLPITGQTDQEWRVGNTLHKWKNNQWEIIGTYNASGNLVRQQSQGPSVNQQISGNTYGGQSSGFINPTPIDYGLKNQPVSTYGQQSTPVSTTTGPDLYMTLEDRNGTIYTKDGRGFTDPTDLGNYLGIKADDIEWNRINPAEVGTAAPVIFPQGTLVRAEGDTKVYAIDANGQRQWIPNPETLNKLYGTGAWANIKTISSQELQGITEGATLDSETAGAQEGTIRINPQTGKREVFQGGAYVSTETFDVEISDTIPADSITKDTVLPPEAYRAIEEGELVSAEGAPEVYLSQGGVLRHIPSPSEFEKMGYKWEDIRQVAPQLIDAFKKGTPITQLIQQIDESINTYQSIIDEAKAGSQTEELEEEQKGWRQKITDTLAGIGDKLTKWWEDPSITNKEAAITEAKGKIANLQAAKQTALNISKNRLESTAFISGEQEQIKDRMNIEIGLEEAMLGILQDDLATATEKAKYCVDLAIKQEKLKLTAMQQALAFVEADLSREDQEVANKMQFALIQYQSELEQVKADAQNRANTYAQLIASYGMIPGLDPSMSVTEQWALAAPKAQQVFNAALASGTSGSIIEQSEYNYAYEFVRQYENLSYDDLRLALMQGTDKLNNSEIDAILAQSGRLKDEEIFNFGQLKTLVQQEIQDAKKFIGKGYKKEDEKEVAITEIQRMKVSPYNKNIMLQLLNNEYYEKYGIGQPSKIDYSKESSASY
uniref:Uncharacterized protein n=1 Tax=viral metagenome TaxID=1070528 RepID=A0A6M3IQA6_9ZZZZ